MNIKKIITATLSMTLAVSSIMATPMFNASAVSRRITLGDSNNDGMVSNIDAYWIQMYLKGAVKANSRQLTAMDINEDGIIDRTDYVTIMGKIATASSFETKTKELYDVSNNSNLTVDYCRHNCSYADTTLYEPYTIYNTNDSPTAINYTDMLSETISLTSASEDNENVSCVEIIGTDNNNRTFLGSGFVVDNNVIATAAHCLYNNGNFMRRVTVNIYNEDCTQIVRTKNARSIHIPANYVDSGSVNYDYGLIYINDDWSDYKVDLGVMTDYFLSDEFQLTPNTNKTLTTSGFTTYNSVRRRYLGAGNVVPMTILEEKDYRFHSNGYCNNGQSGGMVYFESESPYISNKSVVGNATHGAIDINDTYGCRINTTLLRFIFQNDYLY